MDQIPIKIKNKIDKYLTVLREHNIPVRQAILFGSYASGDYNEWSDIDIAIVSEVFDGSRIKDKNKIRKITLSVGSDIEVLPYSIEDFTEDNPFVKEILNTGIRIV